ncbi:AA-permease domain-containing protein [Mycena kentingensis (nom. inval.)]|nr:AA-permease domain-containing protein [Mycena kentingensis (nom. inval.)]
MTAAQPSACNLEGQGAATDSKSASISSQHTHEDGDEAPRALHRTGLFLGTGKSLATGGPASMLICYSIVGFIVYITLLLLGEMATQFPIAGSFTTYSSRFFSPSYSFALGWNYWFNDAISVASDLVAAQILLEFWTTSHTWAISLAFWVFLMGINSIHVRSYGELEYWLSLLKVVTIVIFVILGILVNLGVNQEHKYIGGSNFRQSPFVGGFGGFARVFVTASFAYGGTESLAITAGETKNPTRNIPRVVKFVFWRILLFYLISVLLIGLNVSPTYPNLSTRSATTSPFTIVFQQAGSTAAASFMNTVILTSVLSLSVATPRQAPAFFSKTTRNGVPLPALILTSSISILAFGSSFIGSGQLWAWLQNLVGVSNQIAWFSIGLASWRFRAAWVRQGRSLRDLKFHISWTRVWAPPFVVFSVAFLIIVQGWSSFYPTFSKVDFVSLYIEIPFMVVMFAAWAYGVRPLKSSGERKGLGWVFDLVDLDSVDLESDQHTETEQDRLAEEKRAENLRVWWKRPYYWLA